MLNLLLDQPISDFSAWFFPTARIILVVLMSLCAIAVIILTFMQLDNNSDVGNVITGNRESYYSQNKGNNKQGRLTKWIIVCGIVIAVSIILFFLTYLGNTI